VTDQVHGANGQKQWLVWAGWALSAVGLFVVLWSVYSKLTQSPWYVREWERIGYSLSALRAIGLLQLTCIVLYLIPPTAVLGAVLFTGYLGGAVATYVRIGELRPAMVPLTTALFLWGGIYLREERLRSLLPFRRKTSR
jgi:hypothetical protein